MRVGTGAWSWPFRPLRTPPWAQQEPTWRDAKPALIEAALQRAKARPSGNWYLIAASDEVRTDRPFGRIIAGVEVVAWRGRDGALHAGPGACPHLGARLCEGAVHRGRVVCHWHGLALGPEGGPGWRPFPAHDDGVLAWVRLDDVGGEQPLPTPVLPRRPPQHASIATVATVIGRCEPDDVIANRLDPWHGSWFHPYSFAGLRVTSTPDEGEDRFGVEVTFRVGRTLGVPVLAEFRCPEPRTIVMHILQGEGAGSVVETHATPLEPGADGAPRTAVIEAVIAHSERPGFAHARRIAPLLRPPIRWAARRLWRDDLAYAERRYALREHKRPD